MNRSGLIVRLFLLAAVLVLLLAPITQSLDRNDHFTPHDAELNLCALAILATAGFWALRTGVKFGRRVLVGLRRVYPTWAHAFCVWLMPAPIVIDTSPPALASSALRI